MDFAIVAIVSAVVGFVAGFFVKRNNVNLLNIEIEKLRELIK